MTNSIRIKALLSTILAIALMCIVGMVTTRPVAAQQCNSPKLTITSSHNINAIVGNRFHYFIVTGPGSVNNYILQSGLPAGLNFSNGRIIGTPMSAGNYTLTFVAQNNCGKDTATVHIHVFKNQSSVVQSNTSGNQTNNSNNTTGAMTDNSNNSSDGGTMVGSTNNSSNQSAGTTGSSNQNQSVGSSNNSNNGESNSVSLKD